MGRHFCLLPSDFSEAIALDCQKHRHLSAREAIVLLDSAEIIKFDNHPTKLTPRYVSRTFRRAETTIGSGVTERAAGMWRVNPAEVKWARNKIDAHGHSIGWITLERLFYNDGGLLWSAKRLNGLPNVSILFLRPTPQSAQVVVRYRQWMQQRVVRDETTPSSMAKMRVNEWKAALCDLDKNWREIVAGYRAGKYSEMLKNTKPSEIPSSALREIVEAFSG
ncbi:MAG TPA: hypothetical protein VGI16_11395 [Candidatus Acidoferrum sp.]|jgi:hypothetical protein